MSVSLAQSDLKDIIADYMAAGSTYAACDATTQTRIDRITASGERMFVTPPPIPGEQAAHVWTFELAASLDGPTYPVSGVYGETLRQACLAAAEQFLTRQPGEQFTKFMECLTASVWYDRNYTTPDAASSTTAVALADIQRVVCQYLDLGLNYSTLASGAQERVNQIVRAGERRFLTPPPIQGERIAHIWSFVTTTAPTAVTYSLAGIYAETLRQACLAAAEMQKTGKAGEHEALFMSCLAASVGLDRHFTPTSVASGSVLTSIALADAQAVICDYLNIGLYYANLPTGQKVRVDNIIRAGMRQFLSPPMIKGETQPHIWTFLGSSPATTVTFPLDGRYAQCFLESCLSIAEMELNASTEQADNTPRPDAAGAPGEHYRRFLNCLAASVWFDRYFASPAAGDSTGQAGMGITRADLQRAVCDYLDFGLDYSNLPAGQQIRVDDIIREGERKFLAPPPVLGEKTAHIWSFLEPEYNQAIDNTQDTYALPADFGGFVDPKLSFSSEDSVFLSCRQTSIGNLNDKRQLSGSASMISGQPELFAVIPASPAAGVLAHGWDIVFWPLPDQSYTVTGPYVSNISAMSDDAAYPFSMQHAQTLKESCLAAAERFKTKTHGAYYAGFVECLVTSVTLDRQTMTPKFFGYNADRSIDRRGSLCRPMPLYATYNGTDYRS